MTDPPWGEHPPKDALEAVRGLWRAGREAAERKRQVVEAVMSASAGKTRAQMRALFEDELCRRKTSPDPIWVEQKLDELEWSETERIREKAERIWFAGEVLTRMARSRGIAEAPAWMRPPENANYRVWAPNREKTAVEIDPQSTGWLDRALAEAPGRAGKMLALVEVWFDWDTDPAAGGLVAVHLGAQRVGRLSLHASKRFVSIMRSAHEQEEAKPFATAELAKAAHLKPPYLMVIEVPLARGMEP